MPSRIARTGHAVISSEDIEGVSVYDANGKKVGKVDHLIIEKISGQVTHVVISGQGFLGLGHNHYRLPWNLMKYSTRRNAFEIDVTEAHLNADPSYSAET
jgi:sporulation protein YlmC with PRC-barrel domain